MDFQAIRALLAVDLRETDALIRESLASHVDLIHSITEYVFESGGKRARLILTLLAAKACGLEGTHPQILGAIIEMIHTATLLHDDVIDQSSMRRGRASANALFDNTATVLSGDFLYSRSFELMVKLQSLEVLRELASTSNKIAEGEMLQLENRHRIDLSESDYLDVIRSKTATLFEAAAKIPAMMAGADVKVFEALSAFGNAVGVAFQILDDLMDYMCEASEMGKNPGDDLAEGKMTLPLIEAKKHATAAEQQLIDAAIIHGDVSQLPAILEIIRHTGTISRVQEHARRVIADAKAGLIAALPPSPYLIALCAFADLAIERSA